MINNFRAAPCMQICKRFNITEKNIYLKLTTQISLIHTYTRLIVGKIVGIDEILSRGRKNNVFSSTTDFWGHLSGNKVMFFS